MSPEPKDDQILDALGRLPARDVDPWRREQLRRRALAELKRQSELARRPWLAGLTRAYDRVLEPVFVATITCAYLAWAIQRVNELLQ